MKDFFYRNISLIHAIGPKRFNIVIYFQFFVLAHIEDRATRLFYILQKATLIINKIIDIQKDSV